ncbi:DUF763 domain-containing protein [Treponema bryantii]|uniref:DUF763 domain-containing protein n=1 Tax=Treponema bryantii TaxID=163 RepID=UPI0003B4BEDE|nr:DUF763 domain-containing protein [Treponema bryantii]
MAGIRNSGHADLPLHTGTVPRWLADRMMVLGTLITESLVENFGPDEVLVRLSDPLWFQSFGAVMGMDWHSSGITTSVMYALKRGLNPRAKELGIYVCGGRGKYSRMTPDELMDIAGREGLKGDELVRNSKLVAKVDNNAVQDGFQLYQHNFILTRSGNWAVVQQGMNTDERKARRYHWCSTNLRSFVEEPHSGVVGDNRGKILNLTDVEAREARNSILEMSREEPERMLREIVQIGKPASEMILLQGGANVSLSGSTRQSFEKDPRVKPEDDRFIQGELFPELVNQVEVEEKGRSIIMPAHHEVREQDVDLKRLGGVLATAYENQPEDFESLMLTPGLGPRTLQSLALVSEVIYGTPSRFTDPARFSFAHGGKDGHPFPVPLKIYDESIRVLRDSIEKSKLGYKDKSDCIRRLHMAALNVERNCAPEVDFDAAIKYEREHSAEWDGKTV